MKITTIKEIVYIIDRVLVPQMEMHIKNAEDENNEMKKQPFDGEDYMYNRGKIDATSNDMEVLKNIDRKEHTSELQSPDHLVCRLLLEKKKKRRVQGVEAERDGRLTRHTGGEEDG